MRSMFWLWLIWFIICIRHQAAVLASRFPSPQPPASSSPRLLHCHHLRCGGSCPTVGSSRHSGHAPHRHQPVSPTRTLDYCSVPQSQPKAWSMTWVLTHRHQTGAFTHACGEKWSPTVSLGRKQRNISPLVSIFKRCYSHPFTKRLQGRSQVQKPLQWLMQPNWKSNPHNSLDFRIYEWILHLADNTCTNVEFHLSGP